MFLPDDHVEDGSYRYSMCFSGVTVHFFLKLNTITSHKHSSGFPKACKSRKGSGIHHSVCKRYTNFFSGNVSSMLCERRKPRRRTSTDEAQNTTRQTTIAATITVRNRRRRVFIIPVPRFSVSLGLSRRRCIYSRQKGVAWTAAAGCRLDTLCSLCYHGNKLSLRFASCYVCYYASVRMRRRHTVVDLCVYVYSVPHEESRKLVFGHLANFLQNQMSYEHMHVPT